MLLTTILISVEESLPPSQVVGVVSIGFLRTIPQNDPSIRIGPPHNECPFSHSYCAVVMMVTVHVTYIVTDI